MRILGFFILAAGLAGTASAYTDLKASEQDQKVARLLAGALPQFHLSREPLDDQLARSAVDLFLDSFDFDRSFFLASDVERFRSQATELDDRLKKGDVDMAFEVYRVFRERAKNRVAYVEELLKKGFDLNVDESYAWKRKKADWAADEAAWNELWRRKIKNEYVARVVSRTLAEEDRAKLGTNAPVAKAKADDQKGKKDEAPEKSDEVDETPADLKMTPEQAILKSYQRFLTLLDDNDEALVVDRYLNAFAQAYDPHSDYLSPTNT